jgi:hypothetical protein
MFRNYLGICQILLLVGTLAFCLEKRKGGYWVNFEKKKTTVRLCSYFDNIIIFKKKTTFDWRSVIIRMWKVKVISLCITIRRWKVMVRLESITLRRLKVQVILEWGLLKCTRSVSSWSALLSCFWKVKVILD